MARSGNSAQSAWAPAASAATGTAASSSGQRRDQSRRSSGRKGRCSRAARIRQVRQARTLASVSASATRLQPPQHHQQHHQQLPFPGRPPARGFPRPRPRGRSQPPYVRGARGARGARGRTRWLLIGRCRPRFLLPECSRGRPPPSLPGPRQAQQVHLHPVPSRATSSAAERWRRYKGTGRRSGALARNPIRSAAQGPSPPKAPLPGGLPWIS